VLDRQLNDKYAVGDLINIINSVNHSSPGFIDSFIASVVVDLTDCLLPADEVQLAVQRSIRVRYISRSSLSNKQTNKSRSSNHILAACLLLDVENG